MKQSVSLSVSPAAATVRHSLGANAQRCMCMATDRTRALNANSLGQGRVYLTKTMAHQGRPDCTEAVGYPSIGVAEPPNTIGYCETRSYECPPLSVRASTAPKI